MLYLDYSTVRPEQVDRWHARPCGTQIHFVLVLASRYINASTFSISDSFHYVEGAMPEVYLPSHDKEPSGAGLWQHHVG